MAKTIVQKIGPLYGDVENGSVFGQPNGSEYIPPFNVLELVSENTSASYVCNSSTQIVTCLQDKTAKSRADYRVVGQVPWKQIMEIATDSAFSTIVSSVDYNPSGLESLARVDIVGKTSDYTILAGTTYYVRFKILNKGNNGLMLMSPTLTLEGVV